MAAAFGAKSAGLTEKTSPLGQPMCVFTLKSSNVGSAAGTVVLTVDTTSTAKQFERVQKRVAGASTVSGLGDAAFYVNNTGTMQFRSGTTTVVLQASFKLNAGTKYAARIRSDVLTLSKVIAAQL